MMHGPINVKSPNTSKWQMGFNSAFNGLKVLSIPFVKQGGLNRRSDNAMCSIPGRTHRFLCSQKNTDRLWGPPSLLLNGLTIQVSVAIPIQCWTGPEGSRRFRLPDFNTIDTRRW
jgi:hypothetical protein